MSDGPEKRVGSGNNPAEALPGSSFCSGWVTESSVSHPHAETIWQTLRFLAKLGNFCGESCGFRANQKSHLAYYAKIHFMCVDQVRKDQVMMRTCPQGIPS